MLVWLKLALTKRNFRVFMFENAFINFLLASLSFTQRFDVRGKIIFIMQEMCRVFVRKEKVRKRHKVIRACACFAADDLESFLRYVLCKAYRQWKQIKRNVKTSSTPQIHAESFKWNFLSFSKVCIPIPICLMELRNVCFAIFLHSLSRPFALRPTRHKKENTKEETTNTNIEFDDGHYEDYLA